MPAEPSAQDRSDAASRPRSRRLVVCHPEQLAAEAICAALSTLALADEIVVTTSAKDALARSSPPADVALVSDALGDELLELLEAASFRAPTVPTAPIVVLAGDADFHAAALLLERGAAGSIELHAPLDAIARAVIAAREGRVVVLRNRPDLLLAALRELHAQRIEAIAVLAALSPRERAVARGLADGTAVGELARHMSLSPQAIREHIASIGRALGVQGQVPIAAAARRIFRAARPQAARAARVHAALIQASTDGPAR